MTIWIPARCDQAVQRPRGVATGICRYGRISDPKARLKPISSRVELSTRSYTENWPLRHAPERLNGFGAGSSD